MERGSGRIVGKPYLTRLGKSCVIRSDSVAGARVHAASWSRLFHKELTATDPEFCEGFEILRVTARNCVFLPAFNAETILSRRVRLDLYNQTRIHERRSMDPNESVWLQLFCHHRD